MGDEARFHDARAIASPVLAVRALLDHRGPRERILLHRLRRHKGEIPLPSICPERARLSAVLGFEPPGVNESPGIFCLSAHELGSGTYGSVQRMGVLDVPVEGDRTFAEGCDAGRLAAAQWLIDRFGAADLPQAAGFVTQPLAHSLPTVLGKGPSAGLAAALAFAWHHVGEPQDLPTPRVAATGKVATDGKVLRVDDVREKLEGVLREAPFVDKIFVPVANASDVPDAMRDRVELVDHVHDALAAVLGCVEDSCLAMMDPLEAARRAAQHDIDKEHDLAGVLADRILQSPSLARLAQEDRLLATWTARSIRAIHLNHEGEARRARDELDRLEREIATAPADVLAGIYSGNFSAVLAARAASVHIDLLCFDRAVAVCEALSEYAPFLDPLSKVSLYGSWSRALAYRGDLEEAEERSGDQRQFKLGRGNRQQGPQRWCNLVDILLRSHERGRADALERASDALAEARRDNQSLGPCTARQENGRYLDYWEIRICAQLGDVVRANELLGDRTPETTGKAFPDHYMHRFMGEALARAGETDEALDWLDRAVDAVADDSPPFLRLVFLAAGASSSCLRIEQARPEEEWFDHADRFFGALEGWSADFVQRPERGQPASVWLLQLRDALLRFPY